MKRSTIITLAMIAAIAVPLCASSGWARGLGVLGLTGGGGGDEMPIAVLTGAENNGDPLSVGTGTVTVTNATHATDYFGTANGAFLIDADNELVSISTSNLGVLTSGRLSMRYKSTVAPTGYGKFFAAAILGTTATHKFTLDRAGSNTSASVVIGGVASTRTLPNLYDGAWHLMVFRWDATANTASVEVDGTVYSYTIADFSPPEFFSEVLFFGNRGDGLTHIGGAICDIKIYE